MQFKLISLVALLAAVVPVLGQDAHASNDPEGDLALILARTMDLVVDFRNMDAEAIADRKFNHAEDAYYNGLIPRKESAIARMRKANGKNGNTKRSLSISKRMGIGPHPGDDDDDDDDLKHHHHYNYGNSGSEPKKNYDPSKTGGFRDFGGWLKETKTLISSINLHHLTFKEFKINSVMLETLEKDHKLTTEYINLFFDVNSALGAKKEFTTLATDLEDTYRVTEKCMKTGSKC